MFNPMRKTTLVVFVDGNGVTATTVTRTLA